MTPSPHRPTFVVELQALPDAAPAAVRLRRFLGLALRAFRLKAVSVVELSAGTGRPPAAAAATPPPHPLNRGRDG
jgi:hypothetical protein